jgi:hypothetical protein
MKTCCLLWIKKTRETEYDFFQNMIGLHFCYWCIVVLWQEMSLSVSLRLTWWRHFYVFKVFFRVFFSWGFSFFEGKKNCSDYIIETVSVVVVSLIRLQVCVGSVCGGGTVLMWHGRDTRMGSTTRHVSFYVSLVGGGLRLSGSSSGSNGSVWVYRRVNFGNRTGDEREHYTPYIYRCIHT